MSPPTLLGSLSIPGMQIWMRSPRLCNTTDVLLRQRNVFTWPVLLSSLTVWFDLSTASTPFYAPLAMLTLVTPAGLCGLSPRKLCCCWAQVCEPQRKSQHTFALKRTNWEGWSSSLETPSGERWTQFYWPKWGGKKRERKKSASGSDLTSHNNIPSPKRGPSESPQAKEIILGEKTQGFWITTTCKSYSSYSLI